MLFGDVPRDERPRLRVESKNPELQMSTFAQVAVGDQVDARLLDDGYASTIQRVID